MMPVVTPQRPACPCHPGEGAYTQPLTYLGRKDVDASVFENTREQNHKALPKRASAHWQPVRDSFLVAKIAQGEGGEREGWEERERGACWWVWDPLSPLRVQRPRPCRDGTREGKLQRGPRAVSALSLYMWGRERRLGIPGHKVLPVSQGPLPAARKWGGWVNE